MNVLQALRRLNPRRRLTSRLLLALFLAFALPCAALVLLLDRRLASLQDVSEEGFSAARLAQETMRVQQDADARAQRIERGARVAEEAGWSLAAQAEAVLLSTAGRGDGAIPQADGHGHVWETSPAGSLGYLSLPRSGDAAARRDLVRSRALVPQMVAVRRRIPAIRTVSLWTATGTMRLSPGLDVHEAISHSGGALESFVFNRLARFPASRPPDGDKSVWTAAFVGPSLAPEARVVSLFVPVRGGAGELLGAVAFDVDPRRYVTEAVERGGVAGDLWFATDRLGHALLMPARAAELLKWRGDPTETLDDTQDIERRRLAIASLSQERTVETYRFRGKPARIASSRTGIMGWVFYEGLSSDALQAITSERDSPASVDMRIVALRRESAGVFVAIAVLVFGVVFLGARRITAPIRGLVRTAEEIGSARERSEVEGPRSPDEVGRLALAIHRMGRRVERRVETLHALHSLLRASEPTADLAEVQVRATEAIGLFTGAKRVWFYLHDPGTNRLEAAWPGWNLTPELAKELKISADRPSIASRVFQTGEVYVANDLPHDPYANPRLLELEGAANAAFAPLKSEKGTIGVLVALDRTGGFGPEEADALIIFADAASLLIQNARLYDRLSGTVTELRRASRLKDHFLQNVNHELRTPLTSIVGWTDLFEDDDLSAETLQRGLRQIRQSSRLLLALIDDLLDLARVDRGTLSLDWKTVSLGEIVSRTIETVRLMADARGVKLLQAPLPEPAPLVRADPLRLQQILWNLLVNAIKFTPRYGRVVVRIEHEPERFLVGVEDDGVGIPQGELPHLFERFRQVDGSPTRRHAGMGIGLSLARSLVELHGGTIWAESVVGQGSRFTFSLPIQAGRRPSETGAAPVDEAEDGNVAEPPTAGFERV